MYQMKGEDKMKINLADLMLFIGTVAWFLMMVLLTIVIIMIGNNVF